ncbi:heme o synthase [Ornithinibacillus halotolerans]|uniref:Protoheme IX farnesyltransferase n=1 Tax=Ornithinibacillus halotolerans TaxID=1274357 RepID=A0A916S0H4_9BACI|nr:heme o synthase [Ornithinibacillus halotolerans]GGA79064.1 protoheme IX farnesyltransferase [Ornithinibacillus halotolerans]
MNVTRQQSKSFIADLKSLVKSGVLIANVLPVFSGFWLALYFTNQSFVVNIGLFLLTLLGSTFVMAGALVMNNWYDVDIDTVMDRTKKRPTVTGNFSLQTVLIIGICSTIAGFLLLFLTTLEAVLYSFVGWFTYVILYTMWSKRRYTFNTIIGSISGAVTPLIGWAAIDSVFHPVPIILFLILFIVQMPHTYAIAIRKHDEYKAAGVAMLPVVRGFAVTKIHFLFYILCLIPLPFFVRDELGILFVIIATLLHIGWLLLSISGFKTKDDIQWARKNFLYSVNYIFIIFIMVVLVTL